MDDFAARLRDAGAALLDLRGPLEAGEPWPLSANYGHTPESEWGPREVLGHVDEMLPYWIDQLEHVLAGDPSTPVRFGRIATDQSRLDRIDADRHKPAGEQLDDIRAGLDRASAFIGRLTEADLARVGVHPSRGEISVGDSLEAFLFGHLEGHVAQLREILERRPA
jgi:DinB family protein